MLFNSFMIRIISKWGTFENEFFSHVHGFLRIGHRASHKPRQTLVTA